MAGPYRCTSMLVKVNAATVGVVTGMDINLTKEGGTVEFVYGSETGFITFGGKRGTFTLSRWFYVSTEDTDLLYDLFNDGTTFTLSGEINGVSNTTITLTGCKARTWKPVTGDANSLVGEEISGEATGWSSTIA